MECLYSYTGNDPIGLELAGALKNVYAIASGMSEGLGFENNTRASQSLRFIGDSDRVLIIKSALILLRFNYPRIVRDDSDWGGIRRKPTHLSFARGRWGSVSDVQFIDKSQLHGWFQAGTRGKVRRGFADPR
jgi:hypothetical protein